MQISKNKVAAIHYTLRNAAGEVMDSSAGRDPLYYLHGNHNLIPGMEDGLEGKTTGDKFSLVVSPEKGYGHYQQDLLQNVDLSLFGDQKVEVGMEFQDNHRHTFVVKEISGKKVIIDGNHPLAGQELHFEVEVTEVRVATREEIEHGHVHGPGGHHH